MCGAPVTGDAPCSGCALAGAIVTLGLDQKEAFRTVHFSPLDLPSTFGAYVVHREIGVGGMGVIYEAEDTRLGREVALKMLRQVFFASEQDRLRFQSEAELASQLDHAHIVPIHEVGEHEGQPFFTMKIIRGGNLADRLVAGPIPPWEAAGLMGKIAQAVHHAHQRGIMHRDLKPANILLDEAGEPWLTDFGLARALNVESGLTLSHTLIGTPDYMSPEQVEGRKNEISTATDVWALGVILYQMLTGRLPFHSESNSEVFRLVVDHEPPAPSAIMPRSDRDLETLCLRCLEKDPSRRLSSAGELAEELERWSRGEPIRARRITGFERLGKWTRRHPYRSAVLGLFLLVVVASGIAITSQWRRAVASERRALVSADAERRTSYSATLSSALAAREKQDFGTARRLLAGLDSELRGFDWRLLHGLCQGDERRVYRLGEGAGDEPQCIAIIPGMGHLALLAADGRLHVRDANGEEVRAPRSLPAIADESEGSNRYDGLTYSPDGKRLAYARGDVLQILDAETLAILHETTSVLPQFAWLDDHRLLYGFNGSERAPPWPEAGAWILDFAMVRHPGDEIPTTPLAGMCAPLAVSPDRRFFVLHRVNTSPASWARTLHVYRTEADPATTPEPVYSMPGNEYPGDLALSQNARFLALSAGAGLKRTARVLDLSSGNLLFDAEFSFPIFGLALDPAERRLGLVGADSVVRLYDFTRQAPDTASLTTYDDEVAPDRCEQVSPRGAHAPPRAFATRSAQDGRARFFLGHERRVMDLVFDEGGTFTTVGSDGTVRQWLDRIPRPSIRIGYQNDFYILRHPAASEDGRYVLSYSGFSQRCDVAASRAGFSNVVLATSGRQSPLAVFADGRPVTLEHETGTVITWVVRDGLLQEQWRFPDGAPFQHDARGRRGVLSRDERRMAGSLAGRLYSVDFETQTIVWGTQAGNAATVHVDHDLSPDGNWIASSDFGSRVTIHPFSNPDQIVARLEGAPRDHDTAVVFSRDGKRLYTGHEDGRVRVWDTATWQELPDLGWLAHRSAVTALAVSHEGSLIATSGGDSLKLFPSDPEPGETYRRERLSFPLDLPANWIQFARDGEGRDRALLYSVPGRAIEIWEGDLKERPVPAAPPVVAASLPEALASHAAVSLPSGEVLVVGGESWPGVARSACYRIDPSSRSVRETGAMRECRTRQPGLPVLPDGRVLVAGGIGRAGEALVSCELYDPGEETWEMTGAMTHPRSGGHCFLLKTGKVLVVGGANETGALSACELYDPGSGTWTPTGALSTGRSGASCVLLEDGRVLAAGRWDPNGPTPECELYDPATGLWTSTGSLLTSRAYASAVPLKNGEVLMVGGIDGKSRLLASCERYDPVAGTWRAAAPMPIPRTAFPFSTQLATLRSDGTILVAGGITGEILRLNPLCAASHRYDPESDTWTEAPDLRTPRNSHQALPLASGRLLLIGGSTERGLTSTLEYCEPE